MKRNLLFLVLFLVTNTVFASLSFRPISTDSTCQIEYSYVFRSRSTFSESGMLPLVLKITNNTTEMSTWSFESLAYRWNSQSDGIKQNLSVEGNSSRTFILLIPFVGNDEPSFKISGMGVNINQFEGGSSLNHVENGIIVSSKVINANNIGNYNREQIFESDTLTYFPESWLGYTAISKIIMTTREFNALREAQKVAIRDWLLYGGSLECVLDSASENEKIVKYLKVGANGLGWFSIQREATLEYLGKELNLFSTSFNNITNNQLWSAIAEPEVSFFLVFILLLAFLIIVGPINIFVLTKKNRLKLLVTTPLISLGASLVFMLVIVLYDGFGGEGEKINFVWLSPEINRCTINQGQISKTGVMFSSTFKKEREFLFLPYRKFKHPGYSRYNQFIESERTRVNFTFTGDTVSGDIFNSRSRRFVSLKDVKTTQASIEFIEGEEPSIRSNIKGKLEKIILVDKNGKLWYANECEVGAVVNLRPVKDVNTFEEKPIIIDKILPIYLSKEELFRIADKKKFFFFAQLEGDSEFDIPTHSGIEWKKKMTLIGGDLVKGAL